MSLRNQHIFIFSLIKFDGPLESTPYAMAKLLAKDNFVYFIDRPVTLKEILVSRKSAAIRLRKPHFFSAKDSFINTEFANLKIVITPPVPSINSIPEGRLYRFALKINEYIVASRLKKIIRQLDIKEFIFINAFNFHYPNLHKYLKPSLTVYQSLDPLIRAYELKHGVTSESIIVKQADLVICSSKALYEQKKLLNANTFFIANAADISHSQKALDPILPISDKLSGIRKPIIGYFGNVERRIDFTLLTKLLELNPEKNFVVVGPVDPDYIDINEFKQGNVYFTGAVPYKEMPSVLKGFDVAVILFKKDEVSRNIFPLKLFEYLGAGRPVVSTDFNLDLADFTRDTVSYCKSAEEFTTAIDTSLFDTAILQQKRLEIAAENTWEFRILEIKQLLAKNLKTKKSN